MKGANLLQNGHSSGRHWVMYGGLGLLLATLGHYSIRDWGLLEGVSWGVVVFFAVYTLALCLYFGKQSSTSVVTSWRPSGLSRLRSYLTFLPITTIIQQGEAQKADDGTDENELSLRIGVQKDLVIEAILAEYVAPWYTKISSNTAFMQKCRTILQSIFQQVGEKLGQIDRNEIAKEVIQTFHMHWKEYCEALSKCSSNGENVIKCFKFVHPYLQDTTEVAQRYEKIICQILEDLVIPDLQSNLLCQFLAGILVKSFFLYYTDLICQPSWINSNLIVLLSSDSILAELAGSSSQNSSAPATPLPEVSPKNITDGTEACSSILATTPTTAGGTTCSTPLPEKLLRDGVECGDGSGSGGGVEGGDMRFIFGKSEIHEFCGDSPLKMSDRSVSRTTSRGSPSPSTSVSSALSGIIPTTAFPLLPSSSYMTDHPLNSDGTMMTMAEDMLSVLSIGHMTTTTLLPVDDDESTTSPKTTFPIVMTDSGDSMEYSSEAISTEISCQPTTSSSSSSSSLTNPTPPECLANNCCDTNIDESSSTGTTFRATTPTHYFSFEEISTRKSSHPMLDSTPAALSVDGAIETRKKSCETVKGSNTHELKILNSADVKNGRSPVYEEPEDFATSIAKLRSLLEQKESKKNLHATTSTSSVPDGSESTPLHPSLVSAVGDGLLPLERNNGSERDDEAPSELDALDSDVPLHNDDEEEEEEKKDEEDDVNEDVPELKCHFLNITIPKVESYNDSGGGQLDFYCIQYDGVYFDEKYDDHPRRVILRTTTAKRRFKEFLLLQARLEEQSQWKPHLKGIKAPNRWLNLSFSKDTATSTRKTMLERYLNQLCSHPVLGTSREVFQFMAYGDDGFSLDPLDINDPKHLLSTKLDKLARKFTGVINSLKDVLPKFESNPPSPHSENGADPSQNILAPSSFQFPEDLAPESNGTKDMENSLADATWLGNLVPSRVSDGDASVQSGDGAPQFPGITVKISDELPDESTDEENGNCMTYPLAASLTQLLCDVLWLPNCRPHNASVSTFMTLSGKSLENYVQETIDVFLSDEAVLGYLEWFGKSLKAETESVQDLQYDLCAELDLRNCLRKRIPAWVRWMWGRNRLDVTIERITGFFQNPIINQDLVLSLSELLFSKITPPIKST